MVVTSTNEVWCWGFNGGNYGGHYSWENADMTNIAPNMTAAGVTFPLKQIMANYVCVEAIDNNNNKFGIGNNQTGALGSGYMSPSWATNWNGTNSNIYAYSYTPTEGLQATWMQLPGKWKSIKTNSSFVFYTYGQDMAGNWYSWGRNKGECLGQGETFKVVDQANFPDWEDIPAPRLINPITQTWTIDPSVVTSTLRKPIANAGINQYLAGGTTSTTLYGSGSHQQQPTNALTITMTNQWTLKSGPNTPTITNPASQNTTVTGLTGGTYVFRNTVTNSKGASDYQEVTVLISGTTNINPIAKAGPDQVITLPTNTTNLNGSGSSDPDGTISSYAWSQVSGPTTASIAAATSATTSITGLQQGVYIFVLKVTDNGGASNSDSVKVTVNPAAVNQPPVAKAGADIVITLPTSSVTLNGSGTDPDGTISSYSWAMISGPATDVIANPSSASTAVSGLTTAGVYQYQLTVTDNSGATATDIVKVTVNAAANQPPVANAGADIVITLPTNSVTLNGSGTDPDGTISSYSWAMKSGPGAAVIASSSTASTSVNGLVQGVYQFQLTVTDNSGATATDIVQVTVNGLALNQPPVANAGADIVITLPTNSVTLNGSGTDPDGTISSYSWAMISGPATDVIANPSSASTAVSGLTTAGVYQYQLTVTDNSGATATDIVKVTVNAAANQPPVANAGADIVITLPTNSVTLNGSGTDPDGTISSYSWAMKSGPGAAVIASSSTASTSVNGLVQGVYQFQLTVTDNSGATAIDIVQVTVNGLALNQPPVANAGADIVITLPTSSVTLNGSGTDPDGTISSYSWAMISGPATDVIANPSSASTAVSGLTTAGVYQYQLTVTDNSGATATDIVKVTVNAAANQPPVANAGADIVITLPTNSVTLNGSGTDPDGTISSYSWAMKSGPGAAVIASSSTASTSVNGLVQGVYQFQLTVTDNSGATATDIVQVTVNGLALNQPPVANAGADIVITLPTSSVTLNGSGTDPDGTISSYSWAMISGPATDVIANPSSASTAVSGLTTAGVYQYQLTVTDNSGATATDIVKVTVNAAANQPPVANAGADIVITLPTNSVTLNGSGTDPDGTISSYSWAMKSGPGAAVIASSSTASTSVNGLVQGVYQFQLTVTDNSGATATDIVQVTVNGLALNQPPVANAGANQTITAPVNSVFLNGSGSFDPDGTIAIYNWVTVSGPGSITINNSNTATPSVIGLQVGVYTFKLTVTDNGGASASDQVFVTVLPPSLLPNQAPVANAGTNLTITLPDNSVSLNGTSSFDPDGTISAYSWSQVSGPSGATLAGVNTSTPTASQLIVGQYVFQLNVTDNNGATNSDQVTVTVNPAVSKVNLQPLANAGSNDTISLPTNTYTLNASLSNDPDGTIMSYAWQEVSGPNTVTSSTMDGPQIAIGNLQAGQYEFQVTVTDNDGATSTATVKLTVEQGVSNDQLTLYPNPAHDVITGQITSDVTGTVKIYIYDVNGRMVLESEVEKSAKVISKTITISPLASALYTIQINIANQKIMVAKFIKN